MTPEVAAYAFAMLALVGAIFQAALAGGAPWGSLTWGGRFPGRLPPHMRRIAVVSALLLPMFGLVVAVRAGVLLPGWRPLAEVVIWGVVAYCALGVVANTFTPSRWERAIWLPVVMAMLACSLFVALS
jgi:hypothetical protein